MVVHGEGNRRQLAHPRLAQLAGHLAARVGAQPGALRAAGAGRSDQQCELEAESACSVVLRHLGIDHPSSRGYLLHFRVTPDLLYQPLGAVQSIVKQMLLAVEPTLRERPA
jgi:hypothetical protein